MRQNNILTMANSLCSVLAGKVFPLRGHLLIKRHFLRGWSLAFYISSIQKSPFISKVVLEYTGHSWFFSLSLLFFAYPILSSFTFSEFWNRLIILLGAESDTTPKHLIWVSLWRRNFVIFIFPISICKLLWFRLEERKIKQREVQNYLCFPNHSIF